MSSLYEQHLGPAFSRLAPCLQRFHREPGLRWQGEAEVSRSTQPLLRALLSLARFPAVGAQRCEVCLHASAGGETWARRFAGRPMRSQQSLRQGQLAEQFGPIRLWLRSEVSAGELRQHASACQLFGITLPRWLALNVVARESASGDRLQFDVAIRLGQHPLLHYRGHLQAMD
ncbi:DUF4166 domain-containing protein [Chitinimonas sp.]|uniref:DUF4166 domain-containing protein n=1 Tax=Chitinimonas sp. TaxID=1934313 RepID=UPI0035B1D899